MGQKIPFGVLAVAMLPKRFFFFTNYAYNFVVKLKKGKFPTIL